MAHIAPGGTTGWTGSEKMSNEDRIFLDSANALPVNVRAAAVELVKIMIKGGNCGGNSLFLVKAAHESLKLIVNASVGEEE